MSQALYTAMGGISAAQSQINVVSNNIANLNTIGFKESSITFQDLFSTTLTAGNAPTVTSGGKNPVQIGLGVQVGTIARNFNAGTWTATGRSQDMMIQGNGFFNVRSADGQMYLTRAGNFSVDASGDLVNSQGFKVVGSPKVFGITSSEVNVHIPQKIAPTVTANATAMPDKFLPDLNACKLSKGTFGIKVNPSGETVTVTLTDTENTMAKIAAKINSTLADASTAATTAATAATTAATAATAAAAAATAAAAAARAATPPDLVEAAAQDAIAAAKTTEAAEKTAEATAKTAEAQGYSNTTAKCDTTTGGKIQFLIDGTKASSLEFKTGTSNFVLATDLGSAAKIDNTYSSKILDYKAEINPVSSLNDTVSINTYSIASDGSIEVTYQNGDKLTIEANKADQTFQFKFTTSTNEIIRGADLVVNPNVAVPANLQLQMASVVNPEGLVASGGNLFTAGPNTGDIVFTVGNAMGVGAIKSGGYEASNVDISKQFSDMILAQRAVQANSRVFSATSDIMQTLVQLGR